MKKKFMILLAAVSAAFCLGAAPARAALHIVATTPDLADLTKRIGGDLVDVDSLAKGTEDIHAVPQRPSFLPKLNRADGVVNLGLGAEHAFLPALIEASANPRLLPGKNGDINTSVHITPMEVPTVLSRSEGDQHPDGNPHYNIDPRNAPLMAQAIAEGLSRIDPKNEATYKKNEDAFKHEWETRISAWREQVKPLKGLKAVSYHKDMAYFADFAGIALIGEIEPKPGIAPTPKHLEELTERMKNENASLIIREVQYSEKTPDWLAERTNAKVATVAIMGSAFPDSRDYFGMIDHNISSLLAAIGKSAGASN